MLGADLTPRLAPAPRPGRVGLVAAWEDDAALERFLAADRLARALAGGWHVRLAPLRAWGAWRALPGLPGPALAGLVHRWEIQPLLPGLGPGAAVAVRGHQRAVLGLAARAPDADELQ